MGQLRLIFFGPHHRDDIFQEIHAAFFAIAALQLLVFSRRTLIAQRRMAARAKARNSLTWVLHFGQSIAQFYASHSASARRRLWRVTALPDLWYRRVFTSSCAAGISRIAPGLDSLGCLPLQCRRLSSAHTPGQSGFRGSRGADSRTTYRSRSCRKAWPCKRLLPANARWRSRSDRRSW